MTATEKIQWLPVGDKARHAHTAAWAADVLRAHITAGRLLPQSKLSEQAISAALGVSRNTLREAFTILVSESIVTRIPNRGVHVASPGPEEVQEVYRVRRLLEPAALLWGTLAPDLMDKLQSIVSDGLTARHAGNVQDMADANHRFHQSIIVMTESPHLQALMDRALAQIRLVFHTMTAVPAFHSRYSEGNEKIVGLLLAGRRVEAVDLLARYLVNAEAELVKHMRDK